MNTGLDLKAIEPILRQNHVEYAGVFGSRARGDYRKDSDLDLLIRFNKPIGMFAFVDLQDRLKEVTGKKIDLVTELSLSPYIKDKVMSDLVTVYGKR